MNAQVTDKRPRNLLTPWAVLDFWQALDQSQFTGQLAQLSIVTSDTLAAFTTAFAWSQVCSQYTLEKC